MPYPTDPAYTDGQDGSIIDVHTRPVSSTSGRYSQDIGGVE